MRPLPPHHWPGTPSETLVTRTMGPHYQRRRSPVSDPVDLLPELAAYNPSQGYQHELVEYHVGRLVDHCDYLFSDLGQNFLRSTGGPCEARRVKQLLGNIVCEREMIKRFLFIGLVQTFVFWGMRDI